MLATAKVGEKRHRYVPPKKKRPPGSHRRKEKRRGKEKEWFSSSSYLQKPKNHLGAAAARSTKKNKVGRFLPTAVDRARERKRGGRERIRFSCSPYCKEGTESDGEWPNCGCTSDRLRDEPKVEWRGRGGAFK